MTLRYSTALRLIFCEAFCLGPQTDPVFFPWDPCSYAVARALPCKALQYFGMRFAAFEVTSAMLHGTIPSASNQRGVAC